MFWIALVYSIVPVFFPCNFVYLIALLWYQRRLFGVKCACVTHALLRHLPFSNGDGLPPRWTQM